VAACALVLACCPLLAAQTPAAAGRQSEVVPAPAAPATGSSPVIPDYIISPDDVLVINVYDAPDVTGEYRVSPNGQIALPLLSAPIVAAGRTQSELSDLISEAYHKAEIYSHPRVTVSVKESFIHTVTIAGAVKQPQIYPVFGKTTLLDALSQAGGLTEEAGSLAIVTRGAIGAQAVKSSAACGAASKPTSCESTFRMDVRLLTETGDPHLNVDLYPGDRVTIQRAGIIYVVGAVNMSGGFAMKNGQEDMTVLEAMALAGGLKSTAAQKKAMIIRKNPTAKDGRQEIAVNLSKVLTGHQHDIRLQANDIFFVPDSNAKKALHRSADIAATAATYAVIIH
jgi:polysaccharide export outer membrane protein